MIAGIRKSIREGGAKMRGMSVLILHTIGCKTGKPRANPVMYVEDGENSGDIPIHPLPYAFFTDGPAM